MAKYEARIEVSKGIDVSFETPLFTGDVGNSVKLLFFLRGKPYNSETAEVSAKRADGCVVSLSVVTGSNEAEFTLPNNMYPDKGALDVQIALVDGSGNVLTSGVLHFEVLEGFSGKSDIAGTEQYNDMTELLSQVGIALSESRNAADTVELLAPEMQSFLSRFSNLEDQVIASLDMNGLDLFINGIGVVTYVEAIDGPDRLIETEYKFPVVAESSECFGSLTITQTRFFNGKIEQRMGTGYTGSEDGITWTQWEECFATNVDSKIVPSFDLVIDSDTDLSQYADQTISGKKIFFKKGQVSSGIVNIIFNSCVIYGNNQSFGTHGTLTYKGCTIYDLDSEAHYDDAMDPTTGYNVFENCKLYGGSISDWDNPSFSGCKVYGYSFVTGGMTVETKNSIYEQCDFGNCSPCVMTGNTYNIFTNCYNMNGIYALKGECYFSGCRGSVGVSSSATLKPSTTTAFADHNFATLTIY